MPNTNKDGSMVGMDHCRISSIESNSSTLDNPVAHSYCEASGGGGMSSSSSSSRGGPQLYSQRSRGSHSSSCGGQDDCIIPTGCTTEAEPLLPLSSAEDTKKASAHVNKLHFELFDHTHGEGHGQQEFSEVEEEEEEEDENEQLCGDDSEDYGRSTTVEKLSSSMMDDEKLIPRGDKINYENALQSTKGSNHTVCSSSSSTSTTSSSKSSKKSSRSIGKLGKNKNKRLRHLSTDTDDTSDLSASLEPPDGGWGWVVVAASFLVNLIADGVTFSFGVFFTEFTTYFKQSESTTAWIGSLLAAMPLLSGPVASWLTDRYGCRKVTVFGGLLAAFGFFLSSYTTSIYVLMLTFGVITGFGLSLCYVAAVVIVAYYFEKRRSLATGLSVCGGGIGTFLFAPLCQYLIDGYGWQKTTRIFAGAFLILCACGMLMIDLEWSKKKNKSSSNNNSNNHTLSHHGCSNNHSCSNNQQSDKLNLASKGNRRCNSAICIPTFVQEQEKRERRERRQRYYSCNQDSGKEDGGAPVKQDIFVIDQSSPGGKQNKTRKVKTRLAQNKDINSDLYGVSCGTPLLPDSGTLENKKSSSAIVSSGFGTVMSLNTTENNGDSDVSENNPSQTDLQEQLLQPELKIIPEEKDTQQQQQNHISSPMMNPSSSHGCSNTKANANGISYNAEIDIAQNKVPTSSETPIALTDSLANSNNNSNPRDLQCNFNNNNNSDDGKFPLVDTSASTSDPKDNNSNLTNYHNYVSSQKHHHIQMSNNCSNNDSNNSSINNLNSYNTSRSNGVIRNNSNNSSNRFNLQSNNNNSVSSFTNATMMPPPTVPNGIPTIIIPPAQQMKQSVNNGKMDLINNMRCRSVIHRHSLTYRGAVLNLKRYRLRPASSCPDIISVATSADGRGSFVLANLFGDFCRWVQDVCEWDNLMNTPFTLFILSNLLLYTWYDVPYMYLQTAAVRHGYSEDFSSYLISSIGLSNVVGNVLLGYMGDKKWASATIVYGVCMILCGATTVFMPYLMEHNYWLLFTICGVFGLTIAANYALTSVILVQVVSLERFASAYGLLLLVQGIGNLVGPPIAGVISDMTGTNTWSFIVAGVGIFLSSFFVLAPIFQRELEPDSGDQTVGVGHNDTV